MNVFRILHISDLHIGSEDNFDRSVVLEPLIERVEGDIKQGLKPEIVVLSGDIANSGMTAEYELAKTFLADLIGKIGLGSDRLFMVPGNHDVYRRKYRKSDVPSYETMRELNEELENEDYRADLFKGMEDYFKFVEQDYPHLKSEHGRLVPFVCAFQADCGKSIGLVGLNSAWMCRKSPDHGEVAIGEYQVKKAMEELKGLGNLDMIVNVTHHPMNWLWPVDYQKCRKYFNDSVLLCGHLHDAKGGLQDNYEGRLFQFQAGGAYLGSESSWPNRYQYLAFDWNENEITVNFRKYVRESGTWCLEAEKGKDGVAAFPMLRAGEKGKTAKPIYPREAPEMPELYLKWLRDHCAYMDVDRLREKSDVIQVRLPEIFISLYAYEPGKKAEQRQEMQQRESPVDLEELIAKNEYLLIEGQAGSGKTTILRHVANSLIAAEGIKGLEGFLPVLIFLKDLKGLFENGAQKTTKAFTTDDILSYYFERTEKVLDIATIKGFCQASKALFLLDGLDEMAPKHRDAVVNAFADFRIKNEGIKVVLSGRPHGLEGTAVDRFGKNYVKILPLNTEQVEEFIRRWFQYVYSEGSRIGEKNAEAMIGEIKDHPSIKRLIDNPLMLTAICILYHDGKELPGQRAELYRKFVSNLLYRRFDEPEKIHDYLKLLAFRMHAEGTRGVDRVFATKILKSTQARHEGESEGNYRSRIEKLFDDIEPKCGLMKFEDGQYMFWHLTFQEFLTAVYIVDNNTDYAFAIKDYWDVDRYQEVIELYIGYLSIENKKWANQIVANTLEAEDEEPYKKWLLASRSMIDIHKDRREDKVLDMAKERLWNIIDAAPEPKVIVEAGEIIGWLGEVRDLQEFVPVKAGKYGLELGKVTIKSFQIGKYPVTNQWFEDFVKAGGYQDQKYWTNEGKKWLKYTETEHPVLWNERKWRCPNSPVVGVCWYEAAAFARWLTLERDDAYVYRLPDENEWEAAASGFEGREYSWGNDWEDGRCNSDEAKVERTSPVGVFELSNTPDGIADLSGNMWEWTTSDYHSEHNLDDFRFDKDMQKLWDEQKYEELGSKLEDKNRQLPVLRGGSWGGPADFCRCAIRDRYFPVSRYYLVGFRCARMKKR